MGEKIVRLCGDGRDQRSSCCEAVLLWKNVAGIRVFRTTSSGERVFEARCGKCGSSTELTAGGR